MSNAQDPIEGHIEAILKELGEDPARDGLVKTPSRVWQLSADSDAQCKAWKKNLLAVIGNVQG